MNFRRLFRVIVCVCGCVVAPVFVFADDVTLVGIVPGCGDGIIDSGESCDGSNLGGHSCTTQGFSGGTLSCTASCTFDTTACTSSGGGGGGGSSGFSLFRSAVAFTGSASPNAIVTVLQDGAIVASTTADNGGNYSVTVRPGARGTYRYGLYATDYRGARSGVFTFSLSVPSRGTVKVDPLFLGPTLFVDARTIRFGDEVTVSGYTMPNATLTIGFHSSGTESVVVFGSAGSDGGYSIRVDTDSLVRTAYTVGISASWETRVSAESTAPLTVGDTTIPNDPSRPCPRKGDLNTDCRVGFTDFSILLYWYNKPLGAQFVEMERIMLSADGVVNLTDFSIMLSHWTG